MKISTIILFLMILFAFLCCSYDEPEQKDTIPPTKVHLIPHLGDVGDIDPETGQIDLSITDKNNGIDAVQSGNLDYNWMKIQWDGTELAQDGDIHHIDVYRYFYGAQNPEDTVLVATIPYQPDSTQFVDTFEGVETVAQQTWFYFIVPYDEADNFTNSDTVSYRLIDKLGLESPNDDYVSSIDDTITFSWFEPADYSYRILFFDQDYNLQCAQDINESYCNIVPFYSGLIPGYTYIWRIDAFGAEYEPGRRSGSESEERRITFF